MRRFAAVVALAVTAALSPLPRPARADVSDRPRVASPRLSRTLVPPPDGPGSSGGDDDDDGGSHRWFGIGAGLAAPLVPADQIGGWVQASAAIDLSSHLSGSAWIQARGTVAALFHAGGWAVMPLLGGDAGVALGPVDLFLSAGVEMFGFARRAEFTAFTSFGLFGGGGFAVRIGRRLRIGLRAQVTWLPSGAAGKIDAADNVDKPTFLYVGGGVVLELRRVFREM